MEIYIGDNIIKDYQFIYENSTITGRSRIISLSECDAAAICKLSSQFVFNTAAIQFHQHLNPISVSGIDGTLATAVGYARGPILSSSLEEARRRTYALHLIFRDPIGEETVFKGGTALSKCFGLIERFSEDIDLVVKYSDDENDNQLKRKIKKIGQLVSAELPETEIEGLVGA